MVLVVDVDVVDGCVVDGCVGEVELDVLRLVWLLAEVALDDFPQLQARSASSIEHPARRDGFDVFIRLISRRSLPGLSLRAAARIR